MYVDRIVLCPSPFPTCTEYTVSRRLVAVGDLNDHFNITATTDRPAEIRLIRPLDREVPREAKVSLTVTANDCTDTASSGCAEQTVSASSSSFFYCDKNREFIERFQGLEASYN